MTVRQPKHVCIVTGSRADWGHLLEPARALNSADDFRLSILATGSHLAAEHGHTVNAITADGFAVDARVHMLMAGDTPLSVAQSTGLAVLGMAENFDRLRPDMVMVLGDRYEVLAAAQAATLMGIPVAHLCGGDVTVGAVDDAIRHATTKLAHLHFPTTQPAADRLLALGESPDRVHLVGSTAIDHIVRAPLLDRAAFEASIGFTLRRRNLMVTFHPVTLAEDGGKAQMSALLAALAALPGDDTGLIISKPNADAHGRTLSAMVEDFAARRNNVSLHQSLGQHRYLSALALVDAVVGNSSSGLSEAPSFATATVNIGDRQEGRVRARSVVDCPAEAKAILAAIDQALNLDLTGLVNPYGDGQASGRILTALRQAPERSVLLRKVFYDGALS